jgi:hypothetical protein
MSLGSSQAKLRRAAKDLRLRWEQTRTAWRDVKAEEFDKHYLAPLEAQLRRTEQGLESMETILTRVRLDCQ